MEKTLELEELDVNLYRSKELWKPIGARGVYGGQVIGLSLKAALKTVDPSYRVHSLHAYFIIGGDNSIPMVFHVDIIRTGKTYATRSIKATQFGKNVFFCLASFAVPEISELSFQVKMPVVPRADNLISDEDQLRMVLDMPKYSKYHDTIKLRLDSPFPMESKRVPNKLMPPGSENKQYIWMKSKAKLPDDYCLHQAVAAYLSDDRLLTTALIPFGLEPFNEKRLKTVKMLSSLDHAIWFHGDFRADEWMLYEIETTQSGKGRGFANARLWTEDGRLVCSTAQEGVIRLKYGSKL